MIRVVLPPHLRTLAKVSGEVKLEVEGEITQRPKRLAHQAAQNKQDEDDESGNRGDRGGLRRPTHSIHGHS